MVDFPGVPGKMCDWDYVEAVDGAFEALAYLSRSSSIYIATGAAESSESEIRDALGKVDLSQFITGYFCKANLGITKGDPEFLPAIIRKLGVNADQVAMVGDSLVKDVMPAAEAGIEPIWLRSNSSSTAPPSIRTIKHLKELCMS